ncbi:hypothetical protein CMK22_14935 [Candidatus Poribacteria bacterium]|nr:hypothetical protein [Candidatus Poribacteria bacterium]
MGIWGGGNVQDVGNTSPSPFTIYVYETGWNSSGSASVNIDGPPIISEVTGVFKDEVNRGATLDWFGTKQTAVYHEQHSECRIVAFKHRGRLFFC